jgi:hypothetical protein
MLRLRIETCSQYYLILLLRSPADEVSGGGVAVCCQQQTMGGWGHSAISEGGQRGTPLWEQNW